MARRKKLFKLVFGVLIGILLSQFSNNREDGCGDKFARVEKFKSAPKQDRTRNNLLLVGVMTAARYLDTRAKAVYETWGRSVPGKILFFSSEGSRSEHVPLVPLPDVDDSYPPQKKSFMMLKHMHDHHVDEFEWFMRADDDVYVRTDRLEELLRGVDSRKPWFVGQTGRGNNEEFGLLSLESDENFCMGGPGVVLSRETLKRVAPHVEECLENLYTAHEDVELGRCVRRFAGVSCTWSYEASLCDCKMQVILYHNQSGQAAFSGDLKQKEVHRAITLHPVKQPQHMYRLDKYVKALKIQNYKQESIELHRGIAGSMTELGFRIDHLHHVALADDLPLFPEPRGSRGYLGDTGLLGVPQNLIRHKPADLDDVLDWEFIAKTLYSYKDLNPRRRIGSSLKEGLSDVVRDVMEVINSYSKQRGRVIDFKEILYGYWRLDPIHGVDLILDLLLVYRKYRGHKMTVQVRRHAYVQQTFTGISIREMAKFDFPSMSQRPSTTTEAVPVHKKIVKQIISTLDQISPIFHEKPETKETINFILPLSGRFAIFKRFMAMFEDVCIKENENVRLFIILYRDSKSLADSEKNEILIERMRKTYRNGVINSVSINETFSRAKALEHGVDLLNLDDLMVFIDVDMIFDATSLLRIRQNAVKDKSVYFPIVYSLYNPKLLNRTHNYTRFSQSLIDEENGFWRQFGFGIVGLYKSDYRKLGGLNLMISGWGFEDVTFYDNAIKSPSLRIVRSVDPSLVHVYHSIDCDINLDNAQRNMCLGTQANMLGSQKQLQEVYRRYSFLFR